MSAQKRPPDAAVLLVIPVVVALALTLFAWPATRLEPRDLPVGVVGPPAVEERLARQDGAFDVHRYADAGAARAAIRDRDVYGAIVAGPAGTTVLTASAASPAVAQLLGQSAGEDARVVDVVPTSPDDPRGTGLSSSVLPIVLAGILTALLARALTAPGVRRIGAIAVGAAMAGLAAVLVVQVWLGVLEGGWLANAGVLGLTVFAIAAPIVALEALLGPPGIGVGAVLMMLIGNPWSGVTSAPELLPTAVGTIGQLLPPGAGGNLLRSTAFFDGSGAAGHVWVLAAWAVAGVAAFALIARRQRPISPVR